MTYTEIFYDLCGDCIVAFHNDDYTPCDSDERVETIRVGLLREFGDPNFVGLALTEASYGLARCECCGIRGNILRHVATFKDVFVTDGDLARALDR